MSTRKRQTRSWSSMTRPNSGNRRKPTALRASDAGPVSGPGQGARACNASLDVSARGTPGSCRAAGFWTRSAGAQGRFCRENRLVAYRVYGPALQATGEIASGIDVWSKRVPNFVIDTFYKRDAEGQRTKNNALSYHKDNGQGLDSYEVGPSRGCGGTAVFADGKLFASKNYIRLKQLSTGPIRFSFEVTYAPWSADGDGNGVEVTETKRITLDAGSRLNRIDSTYTFAGDKIDRRGGGIGRA